MTHTDPRVTRPVVLQPAYRPPAEGWAMLWRAPALALGPQRLGAALLCVLGIMGAGSLFDLVRGDLEPLGGVGAFHWLTAGLVRGAGQVGEAVVSLQPALAVQGLMNGLFVSPYVLAQQAPWTTAALALVLLPVWTLLVGAVSRSAVMDAARGQTVTLAESVAFAWARRGALVGAYVIPAVTAAVLAGLLWLFGVALLRLPGLDVAGGLLYGVALLLGFCFTLIVLGFAAGFPLLIPAVAGDDADGVDAVQRAYSFLLERPFSYLVWTAALLAQGAAGVFVVTALLVTAINWTAGLAAPADPVIAGDVPVFGAVPERLGPEGETLAGTDALAAAAIGLWERFALALAGAFAVSVFACASSLVYLRLRQACDGQSIDDVWPRRSAIDAVRAGELEAIGEDAAELREGRGGAGRDE